MKLLYSTVVEEYGIKYLLTDKGIIDVSYIDYIDLEHVEQGIIHVHTYKGDLTMTGIAALELVWTLKPSALEGKRLTWKKHGWIVHNLIAHPLMQIFALFGWYKLAMRIHDGTVPKPTGIINDTTKAT